jgi:peptidoglycan/xylan/chitin deacetylase (PgdA/CDA1 family)
MAKKASSVRATDTSGKILIPEYRTASGRVVHLTFDDGPHPTQTDRILKTLDKYHIKATFFLVGQNVANNPNVVKRVAAAGHRIGNHTYTHANLVRLTATEVRSQIERTGKLLAAYLGDDKLFRPPYGSHNAVVDRVMRDLGYRMVLWNVDTLDWDKRYQPDKWMQHGIDQIRARDNSTVLNHDIHKTTADHLGDFIARIKALGTTNFELVA